MTRVKTSGLCKIKFNIVTKGISKFGYSTGAPDTIFNGMNNNNANDNTMMGLSSTGASGNNATLENTGNTLGNTGPVFPE